MLSSTPSKPAPASLAAHRPWYRILYVQVILAIVAGVAVGHFFPHTGAALKPLGDGFIALIKMMIAPVSSAQSFTASARWAI